MTVWNRPADQLRDQAEAAYARIRERTELTAGAQQALIAAAYRHYAPKMAELQAKARTDHAAAMSTTRRQVFGIEDIRARAGASSYGSVDLSWRHAQDRVADITTGREAEDLLRRAEDTGDELLARAVGNHCVEQRLAGYTGFDAPLTDYLDARPAQAMAYQNLAGMISADNAALSSFAATVEYAVPKPSELQSVHAGQIEALAEQAAALQAVGI